MKLAVVGTRTFNNYWLLKEELNKYDSITEIISGGAKGADKLAEKYAKEYNISTKIFKASWDKYGKSAGFFRNTEIWKYADEGIAFWDGVSPGTKHSVSLSQVFNKKLKVIKYDNNYYPT